MLPYYNNSCQINQRLQNPQSTTQNSQVYYVRGALLNGTVPQCSCPQVQTVYVIRREPLVPQPQMYNLIQKPAESSYPLTFQNQSRTLGVQAWPQQNLPQMQPEQIRDKNHSNPGVLENGVFKHNYNIQQLENPQYQQLSTEEKSDELETEGDKNFVECSDGIYYTKRVFNSDTKRYNQLYFCSYCEENFDKNSNVKDHLRTHTNYRPYKCEVCKVSFKQQGQLTKHKNTRKHANRLTIILKSKLNYTLEESSSDYEIDQEGTFQAQLNQKDDNSSDRQQEKKQVPLLKKSISKKKQRNSHILNSRHLESSNTNDDRTNLLRVQEKIDHIFDSHTPESKSEDSHDQRISRQEFSYINYKLQELSKIPEQEGNQEKDVQGLDLFSMIRTI